MALVTSAASSDQQIESLTNGRLHMRREASVRIITFD
jgi:hypothetical protein